MQGDATPTFVAAALDAGYDLETLELLLESRARALRGGQALASSAQTAGGATPEMPRLAAESHQATSAVPNLSSAAGSAPAALERSMAPLDRDDPLRQAQWVPQERAVTMSAATVPSQPRREAETQLVAVQGEQQLAEGDLRDFLVQRQRADAERTFLDQRSQAALASLKEVAQQALAMRGHAVDWYGEALLEENYEDALERLEQRPQVQEIVQRRVDECVRFLGVEHARELTDMQSAMDRRMGEAEVLLTDLRDRSSRAEELANEAAQAQAAIEERDAELDASLQASQWSREAEQDSTFGTASGVDRNVESDPAPRPSQAAYSQQPEFTRSLGALETEEARPMAATAQRSGAARYPDTVAAVGTSPTAVPMRDGGGRGGGGGGGGRYGAELRAPRLGDDGGSGARAHFNRRMPSRRGSTGSLGRQAEGGAGARAMVGRRRRRASMLDRPSGGAASVGPSLSAPGGPRMFATAAAAASPTGGMVIESTPAAQLASPAARRSSIDMRRQGRNIETELRTVHRRQSQIARDAARGAGATMRATEEPTGEGVCDSSTPPVRTPRPSKVRVSEMLAAARDAMLEGGTATRSTLTMNQPPGEAFSQVGTTRPIPAVPERPLLASAQRPLATESSADAASAPSLTAAAMAARPVFQETPRALSADDAVTLVLPPQFVPATRRSPPPLQRPSPPPLILLDQYERSSTSAARTLNAMTVVAASPSKEEEALRVRSPPPSIRPTPPPPSPPGPSTIYSELAAASKRAVADGLAAAHREESMDETKAARAHGLALARSVMLARSRSPQGGGHAMRQGVYANGSSSSSSSASTKEVDVSPALQRVAARRAAAKAEGGARAVTGRDRTRGASMGLILKSRTRRIPHSSPSANGGGPAEGSRSRSRPTISPRQ